MRGSVPANRKPKSTNMTAINNRRINSATRVLSTKSNSKLISRSQRLQQNNSVNHGTKRVPNRRTKSANIMKSKVGFQSRSRIIFLYTCDVLDFFYLCILYAFRRPQLRAIRLLVHQLQSYEIRAGGLLINMVYELGFVIGLTWITIFCYSLKYIGVVFMFLSMLSK